MRDRIIQDRHHPGRILVVIVDQDENENGYAEADEQQGHDQTQPWPPHRGDRWKLSQPGQYPLQGAAVSVRNQRRNHQSDGHKQQRGQPAPFDFVFSVPHQSCGQRIVSQHPELAIGRGDTSPVRSILLTDMAGSPSDQHIRAYRFEQQGLAALLCRIGLQDQVGRRLLVRQRIGPAFYTRGPERRHPVRVGFQFRFGGTQIVAIEIDSVSAGRKAAERGAELFKNERLVGAVGDHGVGPAGQEIACVAPVVDARQRRIINPFVLQHRGDFIAARRVHQRTAAQI